jgi:hypothetical protein
MGELSLKSVRSYRFLGLLPYLSRVARWHRMLLPAVDFGHAPNVRNLAFECAATVHDTGEQQEIRPPRVLNVLSDPGGCR